MIISKPRDTVYLLLLIISPIIAGILDVMVSGWFCAAGLIIILLVWWDYLRKTNDFSKSTGFFVGAVLLYVYIYIIAFLLSIFILEKFTTEIKLPTEQLNINYIGDGKIATKNIVFEDEKLYWECKAKSCTYINKHTTIYENRFMQSVYIKQETDRYTINDVK